MHWTQASCWSTLLSAYPPFHQLPLQFCKDYHHPTSSSRLLVLLCASFLIFPGVFAPVQRVLLVLCCAWRWL
ncbi:GSCOCG00006464001-RA-CDS [Cotesia congregata]|nr:GSCOCG00006464001-RA-CDS [Cotesia congregata]